MNVNPLLINPLTNIDTVNNAFMIDTLNSYKFLPESLIVGKGINLDSISRPPTKDFYGNKLPVKTGIDPGAYEY